MRAGEVVVPAPQAKAEKEQPPRWRRALSRARRPAKRGAWLLGAALLLVSLPSVAELVLPRAVDWLAREELGLRAAIGRVDLDLAHARISARDLSFGPAEGGPANATIESVEIALAPRRIFEGIVVERIAIDGVLVRVRRGAGGKIDLVETIARARSRKPKKVSTQPGFLIEAASVTNARLLVVDEKGPIAKRRHELDFSVVAHDVGNVGEPRAGRIFVRGEGDLARTLLVEGELDLATAKDVDQSLRARVFVAGLDPAALVASLPGSASRAFAIDFSARASLRVQASAEEITRFTVRVEDAECSLDGEPDLAVKSGEATFESSPGKPVVWRRAFLERVHLPFERLEDGAFAFLGFTFAREAPAPEEGGVAPESSAAVASAIEKIEAALHGPPAPPRERARPPAPKLGKGPAFPEVSVDDVVLEKCDLHFRDRKTQGGPEVVLEDVDAEIHSPRWLDGRVIGGRIVARAPGLAGTIEALVSGVQAKGTKTFALEVSATGLDARVLDPYLAAAGRSAALENGHLDARVDLRADDREGALEIGVPWAHLQDDRGERARVSDLSLALAMRGSSATVDSVRGSLWVQAMRSREGVLAVAGLNPARSDPKRPPRPPSQAREPRSELEIRDVALEVAASFEDERAHVRSEAELRVEAGGLVVGREPAIGRFSIHGAAPGLARSIEVSGRLLASAVTPSLALRLHAELESPVAAGYLEGWKPLLEDRAIDLEASFARALAIPQARATIARVRGLALSGPEGEKAGVEVAEVRLLQGADPAVVDVPLVSVVGPHVTIEETSEGTILAGALRSTPAAPREPRSAPPPETRPARTLATARVASIRVDEGEVAVVSTRLEAFSVHGVRVRAGPLEVGPGARRPFAFDVLAAPGFARVLQVTGALAQPLDLPNATFEVRAEGVDLAPLQKLLPEQVARATVRAGTLRAAASARLVPLREGGFSGLLSVRDATWKDEAGSELAGLGEARARVLRFDPSTGDLDVSYLEIDRPRAAFERDREGRLLAGGIVIAKKVIELTDEERRLKAPGRAPARPGPEGRAPEKPRPAPAGRRPRIAIDHFALADGAVRFTDRGVLHEDGSPAVFHAVNVDGTADRIVVGGSSAPPPVTRFEAEARFEDGMRAAVDGAVTIRPGGVDGRIEGELRGLDLVAVSRYAENAADVALERGHLDGAARIDLQGGTATGEIEIAARRVRIRRESDDPLAWLGAQLGSQVAMTLLTDWEGDTALTIAVKGGKVSTRGIVADVFRELVIATLGQPFKLLIRPIETASGTSARDWWRFFGGPALTAPVEEDAWFAPGDARPTASAARAAAATKELMRRGGQRIRVRAESGPGDRARALRAASLGRDEVRVLVCRFETERRLREDERRDLAASEKRALEAGNLECSKAARERLLEVERTIAALDRSLEDLADRSEDEAVLEGNEGISATVLRARSEDALRRLAAERAEAIRRALSAAGVDEHDIRIRPARIHPEAQEPLVPGCGGKVTIETVP